LRILRRSYVTIRITNHSQETLPGCTPEDFARGQPTLFLGAWFAPEPAVNLGTFEVTRQLTTPLLPGEFKDVTLDVRPGSVGRWFLSLGLLRTSKQGEGYGQVGQTLAIPVDVQSGVWHENHRGSVLRALVVLHLVAFLAALAFLALRMRRA